MAPSHSDEVEFPRGSYERGYYVGEQRAISRLALGLPLDRSATDIEALGMGVIDMTNYLNAECARVHQEQLDKLNVGKALLS